MDNIKDINKVNDTDNKSVQPNQSRNDVGPIDFFSKDENFVFIYKKTEKLATALYMVTNLFADVEPMKWTLRTKVSNLLSFIIGFKDILTLKDDEFSHEVKTKVLEIVSLLEIASRSGLVSNMNFSILKTEFMNMVNFLSESKKGRVHHGDLEENFFKPSQSIVKPQPRIYSVVHQVESKGQPVVLDTHKRTNRQNIIINLLKKNKEISINDVSEVISDCSEKTIQRELISLIDMGLVKKTGERRWSKYSLVEGGE
jgi:DNA-binding HxlR family transcriptional regulator